jgi:hypothetical protein
MTLAQIAYCRNGERIWRHLGEEGKKKYIKCEKKMLGDFFQHLGTLTCQ